MSPPNTSSPNRPAKNSLDRSWAEWWVDVRAAVIVFAVVALLFTGTTYFNYTTVTGTELNSANWELRAFSFRRDPFTNIQLTGIRYTALPYSPGWINKNDTANIPDPSIQSYLTSKSVSPPRWDLVRLYDRVESSGRAKILVDLVQSQGLVGSTFWIDWTAREPKKAAELWPAAQKLVAADHYVELPDLFELAVYEKDDANFKAAVSDLLLSALP